MNSTGYIAGYMAKKAEVDLPEISNWQSLLPYTGGSRIPGRAYALDRSRGKKNSSFLVEHPIWSQLGPTLGGAVAGAVAGSNIYPAQDGELPLGGVFGAGIGATIGGVAMRLAILRKAKQSVKEFQEAGGKGNPEHIQEALKEFGGRNKVWRTARGLLFGPTGPYDRGYVEQLANLSGQKNELKDTRNMSGIMDALAYSKVPAYMINPALARGIRLGEDLGSGTEALNAVNRARELS